MTEFKPRPIQIFTVEDYVNIPYFQYKMTKQGVYASPDDLYWKGDKGTYYPLEKKDAPLEWKEVCVLVDVSLTGRLYKKVDTKES